MTLREQMELEQRLLLTESRASSAERELDREKNAHAGTAGALGRERDRADAAEVEAASLRAQLATSEAASRTRARHREAAERRLEAVRAVLRSVEWGDTDWEAEPGDPACCPLCHGSKRTGHHAPGCALARALEET